MTPIMRILRKTLSRREEDWHIIGNGDQIFYPERNDMKFIDCTDALSELAIMGRDYDENHQGGFRQDEWPAVSQVCTDLFNSYKKIWIEHPVPMAIENGEIVGLSDIQRAVILTGMTPDNNGLYTQTGIEVIEYSKSIGLRSPNAQEFMQDKSKETASLFIANYRLMLYHMHRPSMKLISQDLDPQMSKLQGVSQGRKRNDFIQKHHVVRLVIDGETINPAQARRDNQGLLPYHQVAAHYHTYNYLDGPKKIWLDTYWRGNKDKGIITKTYKAVTA